MKRSRIALAGALAIGLVGSVTGSASAEGPSSTDGPGAAGGIAVASSGGPVTVQAAAGKLAGPVLVTKDTVSCSAGLGLPPKGALQIKNGKVYLSGKLVASFRPGTPLIFVMRNGSVFVGPNAKSMKRILGTGTLGPMPTLPPLPPVAAIRPGVPGATPTPPVLRTGTGVAGKASGTTASGTVVVGKPPSAGAAVGGAFAVRIIDAGTSAAKGGHQVCILQLATAGPGTLKVPGPGPGSRSASGGSSAGETTRR
jgi:hypothetical protein